MKIKVGPLKYKVVYVKNLRSGNDAELFGKVRHGPCEICVKSGHASQQQRQTIWHEIMHIVFEQTGHCEESGDESFITSVAHALMQVVQDNPWLAEKTK